MNPTLSCKNSSMDMSDSDIVSAMRAIPGYIDITPADFREVYRVAFHLARERLLNALKAADIMSAPVHVVADDADLIAAATLLAEKSISGAPVIGSDGRVVGVISEKDFLRQMGAENNGSFMQVIAHCLRNKGCLAAPMINRKVRDIMSGPAVTATVDMSIRDISALLAEHTINRLPIINAAGKPEGIVSRADMVNAFCLMA